MATPNLPIFTPMPLVRRAESFDDHRWLFELKFDGFRALAHVLGGKPRLVSRNGRDYGVVRHLESPDVLPDEVYDLFDTPDVVRHARFHRRGHAQRGMNARESCRT